MAAENNSKWAAAQIWLTRKEQQLRWALDQGDMPVLGLYVDHFSAKDREYFRSTVLDSTRPVSSFTRGLERWPATFATFLTVHLVEGYGQSGHAEVYPYIQTALGMDGRSLSPVDREQLASAYRRACVGLGLSVAPRGDGGRAHVDEYLRQVGVPLRYFEGLFEDFARQARRVGVPDTDDPNDLAAWEMFVDIQRTRPVLRRAIENDTQGYYAGLFLRVSEFQDESDCANAIERAAFDAFKKLGQSIAKRKALIPSLSWRDDELGILLPAGDDILWSVRTVGVDGEATSLSQSQGGMGPRFVPVGTALPERCEVFSATLDYAFPVWASAADNELVVFDRAGKFAAHGRLGGDPISLNPGSYTVVSRWRPPEFGDNAHAVSGDVALYSSQLELVAGQILELSRGPAQVPIVARNVPSLAWEGQRLVGMTGKEIYWGTDLAVRVSIPAEVLEGATEGFQLSVSRPDGEDRLVPLSPTARGSIDVPIGRVLAEIGSGLQRVRIRLRRPDIPNRALATITAFVWPQLVAASVGRLKGSSPAAFENFQADKSHNVACDGMSLSYADGAQKDYETVFNVSSQEVSFKWPVPGTFTYLEEPSPHGIKQRSVKKGSVVMVRPGSRSRLLIYSSSGGSLHLGRFAHELKRSTLGGVPVYLSNLVEYLSPEHTILKLEIGDTGVSEDLVRLVTPHEVTKFESRRSGENYALNLVVGGELTDISIDALDLFSGKRHEITVAADTVSIYGNPFQTASLSTTRMGPSTRAVLLISILDWEDGAWILRLQGKISGRWGRLVNSRGDIYAGGLRIPIQMNSKAYFETKPIKQSLDVFGRVVDALLECYAEESWHDLEWLQDEWQSLAEDLVPIIPQQAHALLALAFREVPETAAESWVPVRSIAAQFTELFGLPFRAYEDFRGASATTNTILGSARRICTPDDERFGELFFGPLLAAAFSNLSALQNGRARWLRGFSTDCFASLVSYLEKSEQRRITESLDWAPTEGDLLGVRHYWWALKRLKTAFESAAVDNPFRKGNALRMAGRVSTVGPGAIHPELNHPAVAGLRSLGLMDQLSNQENRSQELENLEHIVDVIALIALAARLHARRPGLLAEVKQNLCRHADLSDGQLTAVLGFILYVGADLFVFYLGLWEFVLARDYDKED